MKKSVRIAILIFSIFIISSSLFSCSSNKTENIENDTDRLDNSFENYEEKIVGTWKSPSETIENVSMYDVYMFNEDKTGQKKEYFDVVDDILKPSSDKTSFKYEIKDSLLIIITDERENINFEFAEDSLILDGVNYTRETK